jgi:ABC-type Fe3+-hydroxamate transport system substrate-binding protein
MNSAAGIFWRSLPAVQGNRVFELPAIADEGGIPAAIRFVRLVSNVLAAGSAR